MPVPTPRPTALAALTARCSAVLLSPWARLFLLAVLLTTAATVVAVHEPQHLLAHGWRPRLSGGAAVVLFAAAYGLCTAALVPRPVLNLAAGALFGASLGTVSAVAGTVLGAGISFGLGRLLGQDALRPLLRGRWLAAGDRYLSHRGFRSMLVLRLLPGVPFAVSNYGAAVSRVSWAAFLSATALGSVPNTAAYAVAGSSASAPTSPAFLAAFGFIAAPGLGAAILAWHRRARLRRAVRSAHAARAAEAVAEAGGSVPTVPQARVVTGPTPTDGERSSAVPLPVPERP